MMIERLIFSNNNEDRTSNIFNNNEDRTINIF